MDDVVTATHPVLACARTLSTAVKSVQGVEPVFMSTRDKEAALLELTRVIDQIAELRGRVLACAEDVAVEHGTRDAAAWLSHTARVGLAARRWQAHAHSLERWSLVGDGVRDGTVNLEQAQVITRALDELPDDLDPELRLQCQARLVTEAATFGPRALRVLGRKILDVVDPEAAESREAAALAKEDREAERKTLLRWRRNGDGTTDFSGQVADAVFNRLLAYLEAFTNPRRAQPSGSGANTRRPANGSGPPGPPGSPGSPTSAGSPDDRRPYDQRMGAAFGSFLEAVDPARLPLHGGDATTVMVTIDYDTLVSQLQVGSDAEHGVALIGDQPLSAGQARRLACTANILPAVLGGASEVLDLGRTRRLASPAQRKALALRQPTCQAIGCQIPHTWCEAHHRQPWSRGGSTDLGDLVLLCSFHHHRAHDAHYATRHHADGHLGFHRRR